MAEQSGVVCAAMRKKASAHCAAARVKLADFSCIDG